MVEELGRGDGTTAFTDECLDQADAVPQHQSRCRHIGPGPAFEHDVAHAAVEGGEVVVGRCNGRDNRTTVHAVDPGPGIGGLQHTENVLEVEETRQWMPTGRRALTAKNNECFQFCIPYF